MLVSRPYGSLKRTYRPVVAADGTATEEISPAGSYAWSIGQVSVELDTAPAGARCTLRLDGVFVTALIPTGDAAVEPPPLRIQPGEVLSIEWTSCTPGTVGTVLILYDEVAG